MPDLDDPLNLLLTSDSAMDDPSSEGGSPPDWTQLSTLWDGGVDQLKSYNDIMDFNELGALPMEMDFDPTMGLDPSAMHYGYPPYDAFQAMPAEMQFPFTFQSAMDSASSVFSSGASSSGSSTKERRLSVGSSASSSVASSLSPMPSSAGSPQSDEGSQGSPAQPSTPKVEPVKKQEEESPRPFDPAVELAERVRQTAGVMLAVPMSTGQFPPQVLAGTTGQVGSSSNKIPIPRLPRHASGVAASPKSPVSTSSSAASTPPPATPPMASAVPAASGAKLSLDIKPTILASASASASSSALPTPTTATGTTTAGARPKTSHTTIERRYRTNLNARIQSLRMAVPALRVLEDRDGGNGKKIKKNLKDGVYLKGAGIGIDGVNGEVDVIDERGFVDGVKVARKCSKANVLGKAVEYIRVLKKRENRLRAEQNGLKALVCGLVGGPALLKEWEQRWRERFGGEERDEVEGEEAEEFDSDDEDGDDGEEETGKKRKRAKTSSTTSAASSAAAAAKRAAERKGAGAIPPPNVANVITQLGGTAPGSAGVVPEKRKRGRPRKVPVPPTPVATLTPQVSQQDVVMQQQQEHVMLLQPAIELQSQHQQPQQYLLAVFALFSFFNSPLTSSFTSSSAQAAHQHTGVLMNPPLVIAPNILSQITPPPPPVESAASALFGLASGWGWREAAQGFHLVVSVVVLGSVVCSWMGLELRFKEKSKGGSARQGGEGEKREKADWESVCAERVLNDNAKPLSIPASVRIYTSILTSAASSTSIAQLTTAALFLSARGGPVVNSLAKAKARTLWARARALAEMPVGGAVKGRVCERLVLESWGVEEAAGMLKGEREGGEEGRTPVEVLAGVLVRKRVRRHLGWLFVDAVASSSSASVDESKKDECATGDGACGASGRERKERKMVEKEMRRTIEAARELGGREEELGRVLGRVWKGDGLVRVEDLNELEIFGDEDEEASSSGSSASSVSEVGVEREKEGEEEGEGDVEGIKALLISLVLYKQYFVAPSSSPRATSVTSALISPPPSPSATVRRGAQSGKTSEGESEGLMELRRALGSRVFEAEGGALEDARDCVVDRVVEVERRGWGVERRRGAP